MKLDELDAVQRTSDPSMKMKLEISKMRDRIDKQDEQIMELLLDVGQLRKTLSSLITKLGPK